MGGIPVGPPQGGKPNLPSPGQPGPMRPDEYHPGALPNRVTFAWDKTGPPAAVYLQRDDILFIAVVSNNAAETFNVNYRFLSAPYPRGGQPDSPATPNPVIDALASNEVKTGQLVIPVTGAGIVLTKQIPLFEGYLLSVSVNSGQIGRRGRSFVRVWILRGIAGLNNAYITLLADYVTDQQSIGWPGGRQLNVVEGPGWRHSIQVANPGAGADWTFTAGGQQRISPISFSATFVASAAVANRQVNLIIDDGGGADVVWQDDLTANITASQTAIVSGAQTQVTAGIIATTLFCVIPPGTILSPLWRLRTSTVGIQGADQWSNIWLAVEEWLDAV